MRAEAIARVVADLRHDRWICLDAEEDQKICAMAAMVALDATATEPVVDCSAIYEQIWTDRHDPLEIFDNGCIAPPWDHAIFAFKGSYDAIFASVMDVHPVGSPPSWSDGQDVDWSEGRWRMDFYTFMGGRSDGQPRQTIGPIHATSTIVDADGVSLGMSFWDALGELGTEIQRPNGHNYGISTAIITTLHHSLDFLNCRNVEVVEPERSRPQRKRLARTGVQVHEIHVFPAGKSYANGGKGQPLGEGAGYAPVRGHFAHYGDRYDRGKLFGKYEGRFYIPRHARGSRDVGESLQEFVLHGDEDDEDQDR